MRFRRRRRLSSFVDAILPNVIALVSELRTTILQRQCFAPPAGRRFFSGCIFATQLPVGNASMQATSI